MAERVAWGILGTGTIAGTFARGVQRSRRGVLAAVGSRAANSAERFGARFDIPRRHASYEALLADPTVQAIYVATPHQLHAEWSIKAAEAGKHVLCEKPLALNHAEAMAVVEAARRHDVFLMEALMYRCHPQTARLVELIRAGEIGAVRVIQATFSFDTGDDAAESRLLRNDQAGGGILDVGCYCTSVARLIAGAALGQEVAEPLDLDAVGHIGEQSRVDEWTIAALRFPGDVVAQLATGVRVAQENVVRIFGSAGSILVPEPWLPAREGGISHIILHKSGEAPREIAVETDEALYAIEADTVAAYLEARQAPAVTWADSLGNMRALDRWRAAIGLVYDAERPAAQTMPVDRRPLAVRPDHSMAYGHIAGVEKPISRLVLGVDNQTNMPHAAVMFDDFFAQGGTCFDTAYIYGQGVCERLLGQWITNRGLREQVVILDKGAHTPYCTPEHLSRQLLESLERLQTECVDIYMMHRDNTDVPVGEFMEVLNEHQRAGRLRAFGVSNWSIARIEAAQEYARSHNLVGIAAVSNNFSLARMVEPPWAGCLSMSDQASRAWLARTQMPLMPWSSQARGFFSGRAHPDDRSDPELARCWYSEDNFARLARAEELARQRGVLPINVALAYVLCQPFPTFPLIGPRTLEETRIALRALEVALPPDEVRWLGE